VLVDYNNVVKNGEKINTHHFGRIYLVGAEKTQDLTLRFQES
jgi:hypothetical protein